MKGSISFYSESEINVDEYNKNPKTLNNWERKFMLKINKEMWYIHLQGDAIFLNTTKIYSTFKAFQKCKKLKDQIKEVSLEFYVDENNTVPDICKRTGYKKHLVSDIIDNYLLPRDSVMP